MATSGVLRRRWASLRAGLARALVGEEVERELDELRRIADEVRKTVQRAEDSTHGISQRPGAYRDVPAPSGTSTNVPPRLDLDPEVLLSQPEALAELDISRSTLYRWRRDHGLAAHGGPRMRHYRRGDLYEILARLGRDER